MADDRRALRTTFDEVAALYDGRRPPVPPDLFDEIAARTGLHPGGRVLEVGCGTGRATVPLAERGYRVVAVELGEGLAEVARRATASLPDVDVVTADFETWPPPPEHFDVLLSLDAWHWLDPAVRTRKAAAVLRPGGAVAIVAGTHVAGGDTAFFNEMQPCYERHMPGTPPGLRLREADELPPNDHGLGAADDFDPPTFRRWVTEASYTTASYLKLLETFSGHIALAPADRAALFACLTDLLESRYGGRVRRATLTELCVARRR